MEVTSKTNSIILRANRSGSQSETVYLGTKATRLGSDGDYQYKVEIIQYSKSSGGGFGPESPKVIGTRASGDPNKITWNDDAPDIVKKSWNNDMNLCNPHKIRKIFVEIMDTEIMVVTPLNLLQEQYLVELPAKYCHVKI